jgi:hypothetical protein
MGTVQAQGGDAGWLAGLVVPPKAKCVVRPDSAAGPIAVAWSAARTALAAVDAAEQGGKWAMNVDLFTRTYDPKGRKVLSEQVSTRRGVHARPVLGVSPAKLREGGYAVVEGNAVSYYAPNVAVLLSEEFAGSYCLKLAEPEARDSASGALGIGFVPVDDKRRQTDIEGVLWLDRASGAVRRLDYRYVRLPGGVDAPAAGGRLLFRQLPDGSPFTQAWAMRMPVTAVEEREAAQDVKRYSSSKEQHASGPSQRIVVSGLQELAGQISRVEMGGGQVWTP